jgi:hypothetical protein
MPARAVPIRETVGPSDLQVSSFAASDNSRMFYLQTTEDCLDSLEKMGHFELCEFARVVCKIRFREIEEDWFLVALERLPTSSTRSGRR